MKIFETLFVCSYHHIFKLLQGFFKEINIFPRGIIRHSPADLFRIKNEVGLIVFLNSTANWLPAWIRIHENISYICHLFAILWACVCPNAYMRIFQIVSFKNRDRGAAVWEKRHHVIKKNISMSNRICLRVDNRCLCSFQNRVSKSWGRRQASSSVSYVNKSKKKWTVL